MLSLSPSPKFCGLSYMLIEAYKLYTTFYNLNMYKYTVKFNS